MSRAEVMLILILFHSSGYRCLKHFYLEKICKQMRHLFPEVVSYNRFVELEKEVALPFLIFIKKVLLSKREGCEKSYSLFHIEQQEKLVTGLFYPPSKEIRSNQNQL